MSERFDRNVRFFGHEGQIKLGDSSVAVIGVGGLGTHVVQQLSLLGIKRLVLVDAERLDGSNLNRYIGVFEADVDSLKVDLGERLAMQIRPDIDILKIPTVLQTLQAMEAVRSCDYVFGCLDSEGVRLILTELTSAYSIPYFDLASDIIAGSPPHYGGRICVSWQGDGCAVCLDVLDMDEARDDLSDPKSREDATAMYGVPQALLSTAGPSVVSINGVVASLGVTEFMLAVTGVRRPRKLILYYGERGTVNVSSDTPADCYYCKSVRGQGAGSDVARFCAEARQGSTSDNCHDAESTP